MLKLLVLLSLLSNIYVWQSPHGCQTYMFHVGSLYVRVSNVDYSSATCANWTIGAFDASKNGG